MRLYLEYILSNRRLSKAVRRQSRTGFTLTELIVSASIMFIAAMIAGNGLVNLLRSNYKANADSDLRNSLNRSLEFIRQEVRRSARVVSSSALVDKDRLPKGALPLFSFYIADPSDPTRMMSDQIVYYVLKSDNPWNNSKKSPVLWRYGPPFDPEGNYSNLEDTGKWQMSALVYDLNPDPSPDDRDCDPIEGFEYQGVTARVENNRLEFCLAVKKSLTAQTADGSNEDVKYAINAKFSPLASNDSTFSIIKPEPNPNPGFNPPNPPILCNDLCEDDTVIVPKNDSVITTEILRNDKNCSSSDCNFKTEINNTRTDRRYSFSSDPIIVPGNSKIIVYAGGMSSDGGGKTRSVFISTAESPPDPKLNLNFNRPLTNSEVIITLRRERKSEGVGEVGDTYSFLINIAPTK